MKSHHYKQRIFTNDTDSYGIVYHPNYIIYMERARSSWLLESGYGIEEYLKQGILFVVKKIEIEYFSPGRLGDELTIVSRIINTRPVARIFEQEIFKDDTLLCRAIIQVVCVNEKLRPRPLPKEFLEKNT